MANTRTFRFPSWAASFGNQIIASLLIGIGLGFAATALGGDAKNNPNWLMATLDAIGTSYVTLLKAAVIPLVFTAVVASISNLSQVTNAARLAVKTLIWFAITAFLRSPSVSYWGCSFSLVWVPRLAPRAAPAPGDHGQHF